MVSMKNNQCYAKKILTFRQYLYFNVQFEYGHLLIPVSSFAYF